MKGKGVAFLAAGVVAVPVALMFAASGDAEDTPGAAGLDVRQVPAQYRQWIQKAGQVCPVITAPVIAAQIEAESGWNPKAQSRNSQTGEVIAQGLSQFIPSTWATQGVDAASKNGDPKPDGVADPFTPGDAIMTQAKYDCGLAKGVQKRLKAGSIHGDPLALTLAAYNAGMGAVDNAGGVPNFTETQGYVKKILSLTSQYTAATGSASGFGARVVKEASKWKGTPYSWGGGSIEGRGYGIAQGSNIKGFDCSSLVQYAVYHASNGKILLPRTSQVQATKGKEVDRGDMRPGDVIAFALHGVGNYDHIGIYVGDGKMIHAPRTNDVVKVERIDNNYWSTKPQTVRRFG